MTTEQYRKAAGVIVFGRVDRKIKIKIERRTNLNEEKAANKKLNTIALRKGVNRKAAS